MHHLWYKRYNGDDEIPTWKQHEETTQTPSKIRVFIHVDEAPKEGPPVSATLLFNCTSHEGPSYTFNIYKLRLSSH